MRRYPDLTDETSALLGEGLLGGLMLGGIPANGGAAEMLRQREDEARRQAWAEREAAAGMAAPRLRTPAFRTEDALVGGGLTLLAGLLGGAGAAQGMLGGYLQGKGTKAQADTDDERGQFEASRRAYLGRVGRRLDEAGTAARDRAELVGTLRDDRRRGDAQAARSGRGGEGPGGAGRSARARGAGAAQRAEARRAKSTGTIS